MTKTVRIVGIFLVVVVLLLAAGAVYQVNVFREMNKTVDEIELVPGTDNVYRMSNVMVHIYLINLGDKAVLIDAGLDKTGAVLDEFFARTNKRKDQIESIFITHGHNDHFNGLHALEDVRGLKVYVHRADHGLIEGREFIDPTLTKLLNWIFEVEFAWATDFMDGRTEIPLGDDESILVIPFPGHTPGSVLYYYGGVLFSGDAFMYTDGKLRFPPPFVTMETPVALDSVSRLPDLVEGLDIVTVCTGHSVCSPPGQADELIAEFRDWAVAEIEGGAES